MAIQSITNINVDFYYKKYIMINAKQYDDNSRWIYVTCYNQGDPLDINSNEYTAYIRYRKADGRSVLNSCRINQNSEVLVELTEQMLAAVGVCYADLIIVGKGKAIINIDTGEVITIDGSPILSTMAFCVNVYESAVDGSFIKSSDEYDAINELLQKVDADYTEVIQLARSYAIGDANNVRENENADNAKYYCEQSSDNADLSKSYAVGNTNTRTGEDTDNAEYYYKLSKSYAIGDLEGSTGARENESAENAKVYMDSSLNYSIVSRRYAVGGTDTEDGEDTDNAKYYCEQTYKSEAASKSYAESSEKSMSSAEESMNSASASAISASSSELQAANSATSASESAANASGSAEAAAQSAKAAANSESNALSSASDITANVNIASDMAESASTSATSASESAASASESAQSALDSKEVAEEYATIAEGSMSSAVANASSAYTSASEAHAYLLQVEEITTGLSGAFMPMGTVTFDELSELLENGEVQAGYLYNISDNFTTDQTFKRGSGIDYAAGTNVYYTSDGYFDCLASTTVVGVKGDTETEYRKGNINITAENVGAVATTDIATVDEVTAYLGIA